MVCFSPTKLHNVAPAVVAANGGTTLSITGIGFYSTGAEMDVRFEMGNDFVIVRGVYDAYAGVLRCVSPDFGDVRPGGFTNVSVSLDGFSFSNTLRVFIYSKWDRVFHVYNSRFADVASTSLFSTHR